jgi:hypothetical protein
MSQRVCAFCHKRPLWRDKACKRCWHKHLWPDRPAARRERRAAERAAMDPLADYVGPTVYDGYLGTFRPVDAFSLDPLDLQAIAAWEDEYGAAWNPDNADEESTTPVPAPCPLRVPAREHPQCRLCRRVRHRYAESADGLLRVCLDCSQGFPLSRLTAGEAAAELIALRRPAHRHDFIQRLRAGFPELPWDSGIVRDGRQRRERRKAGSQKAQPETSA